MNGSSLDELLEQMSPVKSQKSTDTSVNHGAGASSPEQSFFQNGLNLSLQRVLGVSSQNVTRRSRISTRPKERTIKAVMNAVFTWRRLFRQSRMCQRRGEKKVSLGKLAKQVGFSKKTLDDYILQIRYGAKFGFDFQKNRSEMIGKLRAFVRREKKKALQAKKEGQTVKDFFKNIPFNCQSLTSEMLGLLTDLKPVKFTGIKNSPQ